MALKSFYTKLVVNTVALALLALPILLYWRLGVPAHRGFYCNDDTLSYPYHGSTVKSYLLYTFGLAIPIVTILVGEWLKSYYFQSDGGSFNGKQYFKSIYWLVFGFLYGVATCQSLTDLTKYTVGRLRPHFFEVCRPQFDQALCSNSPSHFGYVVDYTCQGNEALFPVSSQHNYRAEL